MSELNRRETTLFLNRVPLFQNLGKSQLRSLAGSMTLRHFAAGEKLVTQGKGGIGLFVVLSGKAEAIHTRADGTDAVVNTFGPTDFFGELAMLNDEPRTASVVALEDTECLILVRWDFLGKLKRDPKMAGVISEELVKRLQKAMYVL